MAATRKGGAVVFDDGTVAQAVIDVGSSGAIGGGDVPFAYEQKTVDSTAGGVSLTAVTYSDATHATLRLETAQIRFRVDGGAPTTAVGTLLEIGETLELSGAATIAAFRAIRTGGSSGSLSVTYGR